MADKGKRLSVSTWSLHRQLGPSWWDSPQQPEKTYGEPWGPGELTLLELPARLADFGVHTLEICHFHLPRLDDAYLEQLRESLDAAGVSLFSLLIDDGDITNPQHQARDMAWIEGWLAIAGRLGADCARVIAGKTLDDGAVERSRAALASLAGTAEKHNVRLMTENWFAVTDTPEQVCSLLEPLREQVGLCVDFGNWKGAGKYDGFRAGDDLRRIHARQVQLHRAAAGRRRRLRLVACRFATQATSPAPTRSSTTARTPTNGPACASRPTWCRPGWPEAVLTVT